MLRDRFRWQKLRGEAGISPMFVILMISTAAVAILINFAFIGQSDLEISLAGMESRSSSYAAESCMAEALRQLKRDPGYTAAGAAPLLASGSCSLDVTASSTDRIVTVIANDKGSYKKMIASVRASSGAVMIYDWQEN